MNDYSNTSNPTRSRHKITGLLPVVAAAGILWTEPSLAHDPAGDLQTDRLVVIEATRTGLRLTLETKWGRLPSTVLLRSADKDGNGVIDRHEQRLLDEKIRTRLGRCIAVTGPTGDALSPSWRIHLKLGSNRVGPFGLFARAKTEILPAQNGPWRVESHCRLRAPGITQIQFRPSHSRHFGKPAISPTARAEGSLYVLPKGCQDWRLLVPLLPGGAAAPRAPSLANGSKSPTGRLERMVTKPLSLSQALLALVVAFLLGAYHALSPGHGKTLTAAYLVGEKAGVGQALALAAIVTFTHTFSIALLALGVLLIFGRQVPPEILPYLGAGAGAVIATVGLHMIFRGSGHHEHHHDHDPTGSGQHHLDQDPKHSGPRPVGQRPAGRNASLWRLLTVGISGGMVPCPTALVVLLASLAIGKTLFGLALVAAFSLGLASVLAIIGVLVVRAKDWLGKRAASQRLTSLLPRASGVVITIVGMALVLQAMR